VRLGIAVLADRVSVVALRGQTTVWAAEAPYEDAADLERSLAALAAERPRRANVATVGLSADVARVKVLEGLPRLSHPQLAAHVRLHSRRYFLQNGIPLVTDARPLDAKRDPGRALAAAAHTPLIEAIARGLDAAGLACNAIAPLSLMGPSDADDSLSLARTAARAKSTPLALLPDATRASRIAAANRSLTTWALVAIASVVLAIASWFLVQARDERAATRELARIRPAVETAIAVRSDLDATTDALALLARVSAGRAHRAKQLADLARALPDSAFLVSVRFEPDGRGSLAGYAPSAAQVLARLERSGAALHPALDGPVTRETLGGRERERFAVRFDAATRPKSR
jgi:hypothetical protein